MPGGAVFIGRVGALAVALGVGATVASGVASADIGDQGSSPRATNSSDSGSSSASAPGRAARTPAPNRKTGVRTSRTVRTQATPQRFEPEEAPKPAVRASSEPEAELKAARHRQSPTPGPRIAPSSLSSTRQRWPRSRRPAGRSGTRRRPR